MVDYFEPKVCERLGYYVYFYIDPRTSQPFYIGKGRGNRVFSHLRDEGGSEKAAVIRELAELGLRPVVEILKYGLTEPEALLVEATAIDLLDVETLTNRCRGYGSRHGTRGSVEDIAMTLAAVPVEIQEPAILINIARAFHYGMTPQALYDATRSAWKIRAGGRCDRARLAMSVYRKVIREVYEIAGWLPGGATMRAADTNGRHDDIPGRREFVGRVAADDVRSRYVGRSVDQYIGANQNPILFVNCE